MKYLWFLTAFILITSCNQKSIETPIVEGIQEPLKINSPIPFTAEEELRINNINQKGYISLASVIKAGNLEINSDGHYTGFQYDLAKEFAKFIGVELKMSAVELTSLFSKDGKIPERVLTDSDYTFTPDIFENFDICAGFFTILPWRLQIMDMISYLPARQMLVSSEINPIKQLSDLEGKSIGYYEGSSYEETLKSLIIEQNISLNLQRFPFDNDLLFKTSSGEIDGTSMDSQELMLTLKNYPDLVAELPLTDIQYLAWGIPKGDLELWGIIFKFFQNAYEGGIIERLFQKYYSISTEDYYKLIGFNNGPTIYDLNLETSEIDWLNKKRHSGKLVIATVSTPEIYLVDEDGTISGFDYNLVKNFSQALGLTLDIRVQEDVTNFFAKDGVFNTDVTTDPSIAYTPDLLNEVDIYAGPFSIVPWREKLMRLIPMMPMGQVLAGRAGEEIKDITELDGKRLAVLAGSYQETLIKQLMKEKHFSVTFSYMKSEDDPLIYVNEGKADYLIDGGVYIIKEIKSLEGMSVSPVNIDLVTVGWAVRKDNYPLISILQKYINKSLNDGSFGKLFEESRGLEFDYYLQLVAE